jgi:ribosome biogenesis protein NSA1
VTSHTTPLPTKPHLLASTSNDRFIRLHSSAASPLVVGHRQEKKGEVLAKVYLGAVPTAVVWDGAETNWGTKDEEKDPEDDVEDVWEEMQDIGEETDDEPEKEVGGNKRSRK